MSEPPPTRVKRILSWQQLLGVLAGCAALVYFLLPDDPGLLEDLLRDGRVAEAKRVLGKVTPAERAADPLRYAGVDQQLARRELGETPSAETVDDFLMASFARWRAHAWDPGLLARWVDDVGRAGDVERLWRTVSEYWAQIPTEQRATLVRRLVPLALARERPGLAAAIFEREHGTAPGDEALAVELVRLHRLAGHSTAALAALRGLPADRQPELRVALLRELNRNRDALDLLMAELEAERRRGPASDSAAVLRLATVARAAGQSSRAIPLVEAYAKAHVTDVAVWRQLVGLQRESGAALEAAASQARVVALTARAPDELHEWARLLEGSGQASAAFDVWMELGRQGSLFAVDRLMALNPGLYRDGDLAQVLERVVPVSGHDEYTLQLARILTDLGRYDAAVANYEKYLVVAPTDLNAMLALARLEAELYQFESAAAWLQKVEAAGRIDTDIERRLGDAWMALGDYDRALAVVRRVAERTGELDDYGTYFRLARGLGAYEDFVAGLRGVVATDEATPADYLTLAYGYALLGRLDESRHALQEGATRFPANGELIMRLAYALSDAKRYLEAQRVIERHPRLTTELDAARIYLILMRLNNDVAAERAFLSRDLGAGLRDEPETCHLLARAYSSIGDLGEAEHLLRGLHEIHPDDWDVMGDLIQVLQRQGRSREAQSMLVPLLATDQPEAWRMAAEVATSIGEHGDAERYQLRYLTLVAPGTARDWGALGDIRLSRGDRIGAKRAYQRALREFQLGLLALDGGAR